MSTPLQILKEHWGYDSFRFPQEDVIQSVMQGKDTLALMPTGGGKSICYQVPALLGEGVTLVISPLIALMKDQVRQLKARHIVADAIYSGMAFKDIDRIFNNCIFGQHKLLYISPERLQTPYAMEKIAQMQVDLLAVDEAHCISQWGYDFRPAYLSIRTFREIHSAVPVLALTATATPRVVDDIQQQLGFRHAHVIQSSFYRSNLSYNVLLEHNKPTKLLRILDKIPGTAIVYAPTRRQTKELANWLQNKGLSATFYHAGLEKSERDVRQESWLSGDTRIMVATNAFGMGIDQPHVRAVVHMHPPSSLEAYFQEAGRAGRDGAKSYAVLLFDPKDISDLKDNFEDSFPELLEIKAVYHALGSYLKVAIGAQPEDSLDFDVQHFTATYNFALPKVLQTLRILSDNGYLYVSEAVYIPSKLVFTCSRDALYDFTLRQVDQGEILKALLRIYQGIFEHPVSIDEFKLAQFLHISKQDTIKSLHLLHAEGLIEYVPTKDVPQVMYLQAREKSEHLQIDMHKVNRLKAWRKEMMDRVEQFVYTDMCRSRYLLAYFGENKEETCGICDICLEMKRHGTYNDRYTRFKEYFLKNKEQINGLVLEALLNQFKELDRKVALDVLQELADEQIISWRNQQIWFNDSKS